MVIIFKTPPYWGVAVVVTAVVAAGEVFGAVVEGVGVVDFIVDVAGGVVTGVDAGLAQALINDDIASININNRQILVNIIQGFLSFM